MTAAAVVLVVIGVAYCLWKKGTDWPVAAIFLAAGVAIANSALGDVVRTVTTSLGSAAQAILGQIT